MLEIRWHGRGGQGAKTAAMLLAQTAMTAGFEIQAFPTLLGMGFCLCLPQRPLMHYNQYSNILARVSLMRFVHGR
jgi:hypothetical protein